MSFRGFLLALAVLLRRPRPRASLGIVGLEAKDTGLLIASLPGPLSSSSSCAGMKIDSVLAIRRSRPSPRTHE